MKSKVTGSLCPGSGASDAQWFPNCVSPAPPGWGQPLLPVWCTFLFGVKKGFIVKNNVLKLLDF